MMHDKTVKFTTVNVDNIRISRTFMSVAEMRKDWHDERGTTLPSLDDKLISAEVRGEAFSGETFGDLAKFIDLDNKYPCYGMYSNERSCERCDRAKECYKQSVI